jgi:hypothetical protein
MSNAFIQALLMDDPDTGGVSVPTCVPDPYYYGPTNDPYWANVVFLLSSGTGFVDSSTYARTVTAAGSASTSTSIKQFAGSLDFTVSGARATMADAASLSLTTQPWTFECWVNRPSSATNQWLYSHGDSGANFFNVGLNIWIDPAGRILGMIGRDGNNAASFGGTGATSVPINTWAHIAVCRNPTAGSVKIFLNGSLLFTSGVSGAYSVNDSTSLVVLGYDLDRTLYPLTGYMEDARMTVGVDRYPGSFSVPTAAYPTALETGSLGHTVLLLHGDGANGGTTFTDSSSYAKSVTLYNGTPTTSTTTPKFGTTSLLFPSAESSLQVAAANFQFATASAFTIECWVRMLGTPVTDVASIVCLGAPGAGAGNGIKRSGWSLSVAPTTRAIVFGIGDNGLSLYNAVTTTAALPLNTWVHVAVSVFGTTTKPAVFFDGVEQTTTVFGAISWAAVTPVEPDSTLLFIGRYDFNGGSAVIPLNANVDDLRITSGVARYTATFSAPTMAFCNGATDPGATPVSGTERPTGQSLTPAQGTITVLNPWKKLAGQALIASAGILVASQPNVTLALTGQAATVSQGTVTAVVPNRTLALTGQVATVSQGTNTVPPYPDLTETTITTTVRGAADILLITLYSDGTIDYTDTSTISGSLTPWIDTTQTNYAISSINTQYRAVLGRGTNATVAFVGDNLAADMSGSNRVIARSLNLLLNTPIKFSITVLPTSNNPRYSEVGYRSRYSFDITFSV